jgi:glycosyltransferase involved in cell wall biosynthesis
MTTLETQTPLLSVTVLNYNYGHFLPTCLDSILGQTFRDFEIILINDKSTDNSLEVIQPYLVDPRVRLVDHQENKGFVASLIEGCDLSRGKYITVISADDWATDMTAFEKQIATLEQDPEIAFVFTAYGLFEEEGKCTYITRAATDNYVRPGVESFKEFVQSTVPLHSGTILRLTKYKAIGGYNPDIQYSLDAQIFLGMCHTGKVAYIDEMLYAYRRHPSSMSKSVKALRTALEEVFDILNWSFGLMAPEDQIRLRWVKRKAERRTLVAFAVDAIFSNQYRLGWHFYAVGVSLRPLQTICQKTTLIIILRVLLGANGFAKIQALSSRTLKGGTQ